MVESLTKHPLSVIVTAEIAASLVLLRRQDCELRGPLARRDVRYLERVLRGSAELAKALVLLNENSATSLASGSRGEGVRNLEVRMPPGPTPTTSGGSRDLLGKRKPGGQPGNTNRIKHGGWSAGARQQRASLKLQLQRARSLVKDIKAARNRPQRVSGSGPTNG